MFRRSRSMFMGFFGRVVTVSHFFGMGRGCGLFTVLMVHHFLGFFG